VVGSSAERYQCFEGTCCVHIWGQKQEAVGSFEMLISLTCQKTVIFNHEFHIQIPIEFTFDAANSCLVAVKLCTEYLSHSFITKSVHSSFKIHEGSTKCMVVSIIWLFLILGPYTYKFSGAGGSKQTGTYMVM
jgi:hypothetical protein